MAARPRTAAVPKLVTILINLVVRRVVQALTVAHAAAIQFLTAAAELALNVLHAVTHPLQTGVQSIQPVMVIAVKTERFNLVILVVAVQAAPPAGAAPAEVPVGLPVQEEEEFGLSRQIICGAIMLHHLSVRQTSLFLLFRTYMNGVTAAAAFMNMTEACMPAIRADLVMPLLQNAVRRFRLTVCLNQTDI